MKTVTEDGVASIKRRHRDLSSDGVRNKATTSGRGRLKEDLKSSTISKAFGGKARNLGPIRSWRRHQDLLLTPSRMHDDDVNPKSDGVTLADKEKPIEDSEKMWYLFDPTPCSFQRLRSKDPNQHLKDFLKLVDSLDLDDENRERMRSITTWEDLTTRFLAQFFPPERAAKLRNDILMFQQHQGESLSEAWTRFKDLLQKFPHRGIDLWL
uniref:Retrotransposon gag domain-containing protein n=1 Tax=Tanacetum cinerariifolium TaxID=118510 RepID=A0A6L2NN06_TANCI|nr:hypothetical protein [Tanacetum cinerariifolium]